MDPISRSRNHVFISYCRKEAKWLDEIKTALKPLLRRRTVDVWDDTRIKTGSDWKREIDLAMQRAGIAVLLVSQKFLASDFIAETELPRLLEAAREEGLLIFPIVVSACSYASSPLRDFQAVNDIKKPLDSLKPRAKLNAELVRIAEEIARALDGRVRDVGMVGRPESGRGPGGPPHLAEDVARRAARLLEKFFERDGPRERRTIFFHTFGDVSPNPCTTIQYDGAAADFAAHAVEKLLAFGCAGRGRHALSMLIEAMANERGRQSDPEYYELPRLLNGRCGLPTRVEELAYLDQLIEESEELARRYAPVRGFIEKRLPSKHQKLRRACEINPHIALLRYDARGKLEIAQRVEAREYDDIVDAFAEVKRAALLGAPGSGKSTTLRRLAVDLAERAKGDPHAPLPMLVELGKWRGDETIEEFIQTSVPIGWACDGLSRAGRVILLLDGLNEMPTGTRGEKSKQVSKLPDAPMMVSCRRQDYVGDLDLGLDTLTLEPLSPERIRAALKTWVADDEEAAPELADTIFWQLAGDAGLAEALRLWVAEGGKEADFWATPCKEDIAKGLENFKWTNAYWLWREHIPNPRSLLHMASNPFMLTMLYDVWLENEALPQNRGDLFGRFINSLLSREGLLNRERMEPTEEGKALLDRTADLAWGMQRARIETGKNESGDFGVLTVVTEDAARKVLGENLLKKALDSTLLEGVGELRFRHQLLQEYFTALALQAWVGKNAACELWPVERWWERSGWEEAAVLLAGFYSGDCTTVVEWLKDAQPEVAVDCILKSGAQVSDLDGLKKRLQAAWMPRMDGGANQEIGVPRGDAEPEARAAIGRALGRLDLDRRPGVGLTGDKLPDIDFVYIAGGEFLYGENNERRRVEAFSIARYPVTNSQFDAFVKAEDGYRDDRWWMGLTDPDRNVRRPEWDEPNHPRETVSWFEAMAFCAWLSDKLKGKLGGEVVRLPTEPEWERAARGTDGREYPWGNGYQAGRANINETYQNAGPHYLRRTSAVGIYPDGASPKPELVMDLSGNVWEWCLNEFDKTDRVQKSGRESRVLRGGSWYDLQVFARAVYRNFYDPGSRLFDLGFRVVRGSPIRRWGLDR